MYPTTPKITQLQPPLLLVVLKVSLEVAGADKNYVMFQHAGDRQEIMLDEVPEKPVVKSKSSSSIPDKGKPNSKMGPGSTATFTKSKSKVSIISYQFFVTVYQYLKW